MSYNNKNPDQHRSSTANRTRGNYKYSPVNSSGNDKLKAMVNTVRGTLNLIEKNKERKTPISDEDINKGIEANAKHLEITIEDYHEKMSMITNPKPEPNLNQDLETSVETSEPIV